MSHDLEALYERYAGLPIVGEAFKLLENQLPADLYYHSLKHTKEVLQEVLTLAIEDNLTDEEMELLAIGAAFHDTGFTKRRVDNEWIAIQFARDAMERAGGYTEAQMLCIENMILDTQLVETALGATQLPTDKLAKYLLDADLGNLGRPDFFEKTDLLRQEIGVERNLFMQEACNFLRSHRWLTPAAKKLRDERQKENLEILEGHLKSTQVPAEKVNDYGLSLSQLLFLARLPLLLNSSLNVQKVTDTALKHLTAMTGAKAATLFLLDESGKELSFWATRGGDAERLKDMKMPSDKGIVGWVVTNQKSLRTDEVKRDERFYSEIDNKGNFDTAEMICVPLTARGEKKLGAVQVLNKKGPETFSEDDLLFVRQFAHQMALAIENASLYEDSEKMKQMLETLDKRKSEMITVLTHEFRTPVNVIQNSAELIALGIPDVEMASKLSQTLQNGVDRLLSLVDQMQSLSRVQPDKVQIKREDVKVAQFLQSIEKRFEKAFSERNLTFLIEMDGAITTVQADAALLQIVFTNLISNAIRFTNDGGTITLRAVEETDTILFEVCDTGIGIPAEQHALIFEKFYEVKDAMEHSSGEYQFMSGGLGLGLSTVRTILLEHDSQIELKSKEGEGSCFYFRLKTAS